MQKRISILSVAALAAVILFSSCKSKKENKQGRYIPETAGIVLHVNGESLNSKLSWEDIKQNEWFKDAYADSTKSAFAKTILDNPENSGVNMKGDIIIFMVKDSTGNYSAVEGAIIDEAKFKKMLAEINKTGKETTKDGYTYYTDDKGSVAYNKERFVATMSNGDYNKYFDVPNPEVFDTTSPAKVVRDMRMTTEQILALKEEKSLGKNEKFSALMSEKGDAHFWFNAQYLASDINLGGMAAMANLSKLYDGAITTGTLNFDNGKINVDAKSYGGKEMTELYKKYNGGNFNKEMIKNIPSQNLAGVFTFNFKPEGIKEFLKILNMDGLVNLGAGQVGFNLDDFIKANKGDILFAATDIKKDSSGFGTDAKFIFATTIGDKAAFTKIIDAAKKIGGPMLGGNAMAEKIAFNTSDKYFVLSNDKATTETYIAGTANSNFSFLDKIADGSFGGYVNFQYIIGATKPAATADSNAVASYNATLKMWDDMIISGGNFKDGAISQHWEINLLDKNTNSLKQLNSYAGIMAAIEKKKSTAMNMKWEDEDVVAEKLAPSKGVQ
jgi:hypothetical protein